MPGMDARGIIFDFDGTLAELNLDFAAMRRQVAALAREAGWGGELPGGYLLEEVAALDAGLGDGFAARALALIQEIEVEAARRGRLFPYTRDLLIDARRRGWRLAVVSRNCGPAIRTALPDVESLTDAFLPREAVERHKPHPGQVLAACSGLGVTPAAAVMVGDHPTDIAAGLAAGCRAVGVASGRTPAPELTAAGAVLVLPDASALLDHLP